MLNLTHYRNLLSVFRDHQGVAIFKDDIVRRAIENIAEVDN